jgi:serine/threonine protein kinase
MAPVARTPDSTEDRPAIRVLGDRYLLTSRLAIGGMGEVWAATDKVLGRDVAIKILRDDLIDSPGFLERFRAEARHTAALSHPGVAGLYDYGEDRDGDRLVAYLVMELVPAQPLSKVMADRGLLPVNTVLSILAQTAEGRHSIPALDQLRVDGDDHAVGADTSTPHAGVHILVGVAIPLDRHLGALQHLVEVHDQRTDVIADVEHDRATLRSMVVVGVVVGMIVTMIVFGHGAPTASGCTS